MAVAPEQATMRRDGCYCPCPCVLPPSNVPASLRSKYPPAFGWWSMVPQQTEEQCQLQRDQLQEFTWTEGYAPAGVDEAYFSQAGAAEAVAAMYAATKAASVFEKVPEKLRGVFWMKGNAIPEELAVLQHGEWCEAERTLLVPMAPFAWGWPVGKPKGSSALYGKARAETGAAVLLKGFMDITSKSPALSFSYVFESSATERASLDGHRGDLGASTINFTDMDVPLWPSCCPRWCCTGAFTLDEQLRVEAVAGAAPGTYWTRGICWGCGTCFCCPFGGYRLVKVLDGEGAPVQPNYDEFLSFMGETKLFMWSGFKTRPE